MASRSSSRARGSNAPAGLSKQRLLEIYRLIYTSRRIDDREMQMKKKNQLFFQISGAGHELPQVCLGLQMDPKRDWCFPYYRDRAFMLALGVTPYEMFLQGVGAQDDPASHGRQMPSHWGHRAYNVPSSSSPTGTQFLQAVGAAEIRTICDAVPALADGDIRYEDDEVIVVTTGDGTTSQGEFWESLNTACNRKLPVLYVVEDNGYAISVPVSVQTAGGSISALVQSFPDLKIIEVDGCDLAATWKAAGDALRHVRSGRGPALLHAHVVRPYSHSMSDAEENYRPATERDEDARRDPFNTLPGLLVQWDVATEDEIAELQASIDAELVTESDRAIAAPRPEPSSWQDHIYSPTVDPTSTAFDTAPNPAPEAKEATMVDLINACLHDEMGRDPRIVVFGEDVADVSKVEYEGQVKGKGGVFKVTHGLQSAYGAARVFNSPLAEANIVGRAIGMALRGLKPVVEIQFFDYIWPAYQQIRNELANMRWRSGGEWSCPMVIRVPTGGYLTGGAPYHSQSGEVLFTHIPGLRVVVPSTAQDASGLLRTAIRCDDPVLFLEPKHLYRQTYNKGRNPGPDYLIPLGSARTARPGRDLTIITFGCVVQRAVRAAQLLERDGIDVEVIDLRSVAPYDWDAISASVKRTNKVIVAHEDHVSFGYGAEIAARISDELFEYLDGPVRRVCGKDSFVAYAPVMEDTILPQIDDLVETARKLYAY